MKTNPHLSRIGDGAWLFTPPKEQYFQWRRSGNVVIIESDDTLCFIDSGGSSTKKLLLEIAMEFMKKSRRNLYCQHTHGHIDHISGSPLLKEKLGAEILASNEAIPYVQDQMALNLELERESLIVPFGELFTAPEWFVRGIMRFTLGKGKRVDHVKQIGDETPIELGYRQVELPGHHHGHIGFFSDDSGILVAGDLIDPRHKMKPGLTSPASDWAGMKKAMQTVLSLNPEVVVPGHGEPFLGIEAIEDGFRNALQTLETVKEKTLALIEEHPRSIEELADSMIGMGIGPGTVFRRMFIHSVLRYLIKERRIVIQGIEKGRMIFAKQ